MITFEEALPEIKDWLSLHGVNPGDVPRSVVPVCNVDGSVWLPLYARNADGQKYMAGEDIAMTEATIRPATEPSAAVMGWLAGEVRPPEEIAAVQAGGTPEPTDG